MKAKKRFLSILLSLALVLAIAFGLLPGLETTAKAAAYTTNQTNLSWNEEDIFVKGAQYSFVNSGNNYVNWEGDPEGSATTTVGATIGIDGTISYSNGNKQSLPSGCNAWKLSTGYADFIGEVWYFTGINYNPILNDASYSSTTSFTFDGNAKTAITNGQNVTITGTNSATNAGDYTAYVTPQSGHAWSDGSQSQKTVSWKINKAANPLSYTGTQSLTKTFSTSAQTAPLTAAINNQGTLSYEIQSQKQGPTNVSYFSLSGTTLTIAANTPANTYSVAVRATAAGDNNYNSGTADSTVTVTVNKANGSGSVTMAGWTYGNTASNPNPTSTTNGTNSVTYKYKVRGTADSTYTDNKPSNAGNYTVQAIFAATTNYNAATAMADFTISKANINPTVSMSGWTYGGTESNPSVSGNTGNGTVAYQYKVSTAADSTYSSTKPSNAGTYTVKATVGATTNYNGNTTTTNFTISKASINPSVSIEGWTYLQTPNNPTVSGNPGDGIPTYHYTGRTNGEQSYNSADAPIQAGRYTVTATVPETANYQGGTASKEFTVSRANLNPTVSITGWIYGELAKTPTVSDNTGNGEVTYNYKNQEGTAAYDSPLVPQNAGDYTLTATVAETTNYLGNPATCDFTIARQDITPNLESGRKGCVTFDPATVPNGTRPTITMIDEQGKEIPTSEYKVAYNELDHEVTIQDRWTGTAGYGNYNITEVTLLYPFEAGTATVKTVPATSVLTYNGKDQQLLSTTGAATNGTMAYALGENATIAPTDSSAWKDNITEITGKNAGDYYVWYKAKGDVTNYKDSTPVAIRVTINKAPLTVTAKNHTITYGDAPANDGVTYEVFQNGEKETDEGILTGTLYFRYTYSKGGDVNAEEGKDYGEFEITPYGLSSGNYRITFASGTLIVKKKSVTISATAADKVYDGNTTAIISSSTVNKTDLYPGDTLTAVPGTANFEDKNVGANKTVTFSGFSLGGEKLGNYILSAQPGTTTAKITPMALTVTANSQTKIYGEVDPALTYTHSDLASGDTDAVFTGALTRNAGENVDSYSITQGTLSAGNNYNISYTGKDLTITQRSITITADSDSKTYDGTALSKNSYSITTGSLASGDHIESVTVAGSQTTVGNSDNIPSAAVIKNTAGADVTSNYNITYNNGTLTISKKALTVTANAKTITYGDEPANDGVTYSGFVSGQDERVLGGTLSYAYSYAQYGNVGNTYTITPSDLTSANYDITFASGTLTVEPKEVGLSWGESSFTYNGNAQVPAATATGLVNNDDVGVTVSGAQTNANTTGSQNYTATATILTGAKAGNYKLPGDVTTTFTIAPKTVGIEWSNLSFTYDKQSHAPAATATGLVNGDSCTVTVTGAQTDADSYTATATALSNNNYKLPTEGNTQEFTIRPKPVTLSWTGNPVYNGSEQSVTATVSNAESGDTVNVTNYTGNKGTDVNNYTATATELSNTNYTLTGGTNVSHSWQITQAANSASVSIDNWTYGDAAKTARTTANFGADTVTYQYKVKNANDSTYANVVPTAAGEYTVKATITETGNYAAATATADFIIAQKTVTLSWAANPAYTGSKLTMTATVSNAEDGDTVKVITYTGNTGTDAGSYTAEATALSNTNYKLPANASHAWQITQAANSVTSLSITGWTYGNTANDPSLTASFGVSTVNYQYKVKDAADGTYSATVPTAAGEYTIKATIAATGNYAAASDTEDFTIARRPVIVSGITAGNKIYDGNTTATLMYTGVTFGNIKDGDNLTVTATGAFNNKNVGNGKTVTITDLTLGGTSVSNYVLATTGQQNGTTANITAKEITVSGITAENKTYDGTKTATLVYTGANYGGIVTGDNLTVTAKGTFNTKDVGGDKPVTISDLALDGDSKDNYILATNGQQTETTANITAKGITVSGITAKDKIYDGTKTATLVYNDASYDGIVTGDSLTVSAAGTFADANAGTGKSVTISALTLGGADAGNYALAVSGQQESTTADITAKEVTISGITAKDKTYDGTTIATLDYSAVTFSGIVTSDTLSVTATGTFNTKDVDTDKTVTITDLRLAGVSADNYVLADSGQQTSTTANVIRKEVIVKANDKSKIYGHRDPAYNANVTGMVSGEDSSLIVYNFDRTAGDDVGTYIIKPIGETNQGNYTVRYQTGTLTITKRLLTVTAKSEEFTYDGAAHANETVTVTEGALMTGDELVASATGSVTNVADTAEGNNAIATGYKVMHGNEDVTANYEITTVAGTLRINPKAVTVTAKSEEFTYDGNAHSNEGYDVEGLVGDDAISAVVTGSITFPSESPVTNELTSYEFTKGAPGNYSVTTANGKLTMKKASVAIKITAASQSWTYDGEAHSNANVTVTEGSLLTGDELVASATGSVTNVADMAEGNNPIAEGYKVMHGDKDVTDNYNITSVAGTLRINPKAVTVTAKSQEFTYNGNAHSNNGYDVTGLEGDDAISAVVTGSITFPSESPVTNELTRYEFTKGTPGNYSVTTANGKLTMKKASVAITITAASQSWTYDGEAHSNANVTVTEGSLLTGDELVARTTGSVKNVADTATGNNPIATGYKIMHGEEDVTANYEITTVAGTLRINPKTVTVTAKSEEFTYDGNAHSNNGYDVTGLEGDDAISAVVTGSITFPSESPVTNELKSYEFTTGTPGNYSVTTANGELTMVNAAQEITITAASESWTYNGAAHTNTNVTVTEGSLLTGDELVARATGSVKNVADTATGNNPIATGYKIMHGEVDVTANYEITPIAGTLRITKATAPAVTEPTPDAVTYDPGKTLADVALTNGWTWVEETTVPTVNNNGYEAALTVDDANYDYTDVEGYDAETHKVTRTVALTVNKADSTAATVTANNRTYDGTEKPLVTVTGEAVGGTMQYALGSDATTAPTTGYTTTIPTTTDAGTYYVWYKAVGDDNHMDTAVAGPIIVTVGKKDVTVSGITAADKQYDGTTTAALDCSAAVFEGKLEGDTLSVTATGAFADANAGENKTVTISGLTLGGEDAGNYQLAAEGQQTSTTASITAKELTAAASDVTAVYDGKAHSIGVTVTGPETYSIAYGTEEGTYGAENPALTDAGTITVYYQVTADNYGTYTGSAKVTVTPKEAGLTWSDTAFTYDGGSHIPTAKATGILDGDTCTVTVTGEQSAAGSYTATAAALSNPNYQLPQEQTQAFTIARANASVTAPAANSLTYSGAAQTLVTAGSASGGTLQYALGTDGTTAPDAGWGESLPAGTEAKTYYVWYKVSGDANHNDTTPACLAVTIRPDGSSTGGVTGNTLTYNGTAQTLVTEGTASGGTLLYALGENAETAPAEGWSESVPTGTDVKDYFVWYKVAGDENHNDSTPACVTVSIAKKDISDAAITLSSLQFAYNGAEHAVSVADVTYDGSSLPSDAYEVTGSLSGTNAGIYTVTITGKGNYTGEASVSWSITPGAIQASAENVTVPYDGNAHGITVTVTEPAGGYSIRYGTAEGTYDLTESPSLNDAGNLQVFYQVTAENYTAFTGSASITVEAPEPAPEPGDIKSEVHVSGGAPQTTSDISEETAKAILTEAETAALETGESILVYLDVEGMSEGAVPAADLQAAQQLAKEGGQTIALYLDVTLWKRVGDADAVQIHETNGKVITFTVQVPAELQNVPEGYTRIYRLIRIHEGVATVVAESTGTTLSASSDEFSTYVLTYEDVENTEPTVTPEPTATPEPTVTPETTITPEATVTPQATATPVPAAAGDSSGSNGSSGSSAKETKTADNTPIGLMIVLLACGALESVMLTREKLKRRNR